MRKLFRYGSFVLVLAIGIVAAVTPANAQLSEIMRRMDATNKALTSVRAGIELAKYDAALKDYDKPLVGTTIYLPKTPATKNKLYVRIDWTSPAEEHMVIIGDDYQLFRPRLNQVVFGNVGKNKSSAGAGNALGFMNMSRDQLRANYDVVYIGEEQLKDTTRTIHLQLTPKTQMSYKLAELWVDGNGMPHQARITERNDDSTTVLLSNIRQNEKVNTNEFKLNTGNAKRVPA